jgi:hypothetical protein
MKTTKTAMFLSLTFILVIAAACVQTKMVSVWKEPTFNGPPLKNIVVVALTADATNRRIVEDVFADKLGKSGVKAIQSYVALKGADPSVEVLKALVKEQGYDGVLAAWLVGKDEKTHYVSGSVSVGYGYYGGSFWGAYPSVYTTVYSPGYMATETSVRVETGIWTTEGDGKRIWAGESDTTDPSSVAQISKEIATEVIAKAHREGVI